MNTLRLTLASPTIICGCDTPIDILTRPNISIESVISQVAYGHICPVTEAKRRELAVRARVKARTRGTTTLVFLAPNTPTVNDDCVDETPRRRRRRR